MKNLALVLVTITPFFTAFSSESISFRDGTFLKANIYSEKGFEPNKDGVILSLDNLIYFHHYPATDNSLSTPLFYNVMDANPYHMSSCVPSRISFFHFETFTLSGMKEKISHMNIPMEKKTEAIKGINRAMSEAPPKDASNPELINKKYTQRWKTKTMNHVGRHFSFKNKKAIWGGDLKFLKKYDFNNGSSTLAKKRR